MVSEIGLTPCIPPSWKNDNPPSRKKFGISMLKNNLLGPKILQN